MKRLGMFLMLVLSMAMIGHHAMAQEITIVLRPGCNWISYPNAEVMSIATALGDFTPAEGDVIKSQTKGTKYVNGQWRGTLRQFTPGLGYQYYSTRTTTVSFSFNTGIPQVTVTTATPTNVTTTSAVCGGTVAMGGQGHVFARGFCWSTHHNPTYDDNHTSDGTNIGSFSHTLEGLNPNTVYYVRAYVVSDGGLKYGNEKGFRTLEGASVPEGAIDSKFTINANGDQVYFSQGNLQYNAVQGSHQCADGTIQQGSWRFAENQWDYVGTNNSNVSQNYNGWIDLFGWGTSGWDNGNIYYHPWDTQNNGDKSQGYGYGPIGHLTGSNANADWGVYNAISNGGNTTNTWRTLTYAEWYYVFISRSTNSGIRYAKACVNSVNGIVLLPDDWSTSYYSLNNVNTNDASFTSNSIYGSQWDILEQHGAVFLPAAGSRNETSVSAGAGGQYYSVSQFFSGNNFQFYQYGYANVMTFSDSNISFYLSVESLRIRAKCLGLSVRLVKDVE